MQPLYVLHAVQVGTTTISGVTGHSANTGSRVQSEALDGNYAGRAAYMTGQEPKADFSTKNLLGAISTLGTVVKSIGTLGGLKLFLQAVTGPDTASSGAVRVLTDGLIFPSRLSASQGGDAEISYETAIVQGSSPVVDPQTGTLPTITAAPPVYTLGPCWIGGVRMEGLKSVELSFGVSAMTEAVDGAIRPTRVGIQAFNPVLTVTGIEPDWFGEAGIPLDGKIATQANTIISLQQRKHGSSLWGAAESKHVLLNVCGMAVVQQLHSARGRSPTGAQVALHVVDDGINPLVKSAYNQTIPS